ncbi:MAG: response regulator transcription factor [Candidatus Acidiferrales bacterium]
MTKNASIRILIADDNDHVRNDLCSLLQEQRGWVVCGQAKNGTDAVREAIRLTPDVILVDVSMPDMNGFEVANRIHEQLPVCEILIVTEHDYRLLAHIERPPGVRGYVMKSHAHSDLVPAVDAASKHRPLSASASA